MIGGSNSPFPLIQPYADLSMGGVISEFQGQSTFVGHIESHPGWIYKEYKRALSPAEEAELDLLIKLPVKLTPDERRVIKGGASWPTARVTRDNRTCGVVLPLAPEAFDVDFRLPGGRVQRRPLTIDWLAQSESAQRARGITPPSLSERIAACASLAATAELLERHGIVYLDWSLTNTFWSFREHTTYVIDVDGCSFGPRPMIESFGWEDPLFPMRSAGGQAVDRYRIALLVARCLTTERPSTTAAVAAAKLGELAQDSPELRTAHQLITRALHATHADGRPAIAELVAALRRGRWRRYTPPKPGAAAPEASAAPRPASTRPAPTRPTPTPPARVPFPLTPLPLPAQPGPPAPFTTSNLPVTAKPSDTGGSAAAAVAFVVILAIVLLAVFVLL